MTFPYEPQRPVSAMPDADSRGGLDFEARPFFPGTNSERAVVEPGPIFGTRDR
jgi:hypothetical protein